MPWVGDQPLSFRVTLFGRLFTEHLIGHHGYQNMESRVSSIGRQNSPIVRNMGSGTGLPGFESQPCHLLICGEILNKMYNLNCQFPYL